MFEVAAYNIERLRAIGYLRRFRHYLDQIGLTKQEQDLVARMSRTEIVQAVHRAGQRNGWLATPEAHLRANNCRLLLIVGERPSAPLGVAPIAAEDTLNQLQAFATDARLWVGVDPFDMTSFRRDLALVQHPRFAGFALSPFMAGVPLDHEACAECLKEIADRGIAVWVHCSAHFRPDVIFDIAHPRSVDAVLMRYPGLRVVMGHAGWPWTAEACIVALRHPSVAIEFSTFPPVTIRQEGYALSPLLANARALKGRIFFGSGATILPRRIREMLNQFDDPVSGALPGEWRGQALLDWMGVAA